MKLHRQRCHLALNSLCYLTVLQTMLCSCRDFFNLQPVCTGLLVFRLQLIMLRTLTSRSIDTASRYQLSSRTCVTETHSLTMKHRAASVKTRQFCDMTTCRGAGLPVSPRAETVTSQCATRVTTSWISLPATKQSPHGKPSWQFE